MLSNKLSSSPTDFFFIYLLTPSPLSSSCFHTFSFSPSFHSQPIHIYDLYVSRLISSNMQIKQDLLSEHTLRLKFAQKIHVTTSPFKPLLVLPYSLYFSSPHVIGVPHMDGYRSGWARAPHWAWRWKPIMHFLFMSCKVQRAALHMRDPVNKLRASCFIQHGKFLFLGTDRSAWKEVNPQGLSPSLGLIWNTSSPREHCPGVRKAKQTNRSV